MHCISLLYFTLYFWNNFLLYFNNRNYLSTFNCLLSRSYTIEGSKWSERLEQRFIIDVRLMHASIRSKTSFLKERTFIYPPSSCNICLPRLLCVSSTQFTFFVYVTVIRRRLSRFKIGTNRRGKEKRIMFWRSNDRSRQFRIFFFRLSRLSPWTWIDFYTQLRATDWNRVTFYIYPHFPLTIGLSETAADIRGLFGLTITSH